MKLSCGACTHLHTHGVPCAVLAGDISPSWLGRPLGCRIGERHHEHEDEIHHPRQIEELEPAHIFLADALAHPRAVVVELFDAGVAVFAMVRAQRLVDLTHVAEPTPGGLRVFRQRAAGAHNARI